MKFVWALLVAAAACSADAKRIVGGDATTIDQHPSIVQVDFMNNFVWSPNCAATILTSRFMVSAAHCFWGTLFSITNRRIRAGTSYRNSGGVIVGLRRNVNHPYFGNYYMDGDITVLELEAALTYSDKIRQVAIPPQGFELPDNLPVIKAGWGSIYDGGPASPVLQVVTVFTINNTLCKERYEPNDRVSESMICAGILDEGGKDACAGDSGGPVYYDNILIGVISFAESCATEYYPGVSTKISAYTEWIVATVAS